MENNATNPIPSKIRSNLPDPLSNAWILELDAEQVTKEFSGTGSEDLHYQSTVQEKILRLLFL